MDGGETQTTALSETNIISVERSIPKRQAAGELLYSLLLTLYEGSPRTLHLGVILLKESCSGVHAIFCSFGVSGPYLA